MQQLETLRFLPQGITWEALIARLGAWSCRGAIVGPHGSGKTTLLEQLADQVRELGRRPRLLFRNRDGGGALPAAWREVLRDLGAADVLLVDGYGHCSAAARWSIRRAAARRGAGLLVTAHRRTALPTLLRTTTSPDLLRTLVQQMGVSISTQRAETLWRRHRGNLRAALRELYDELAAY